MYDGRAEKLTKSVPHRLANKLYLKVADLAAEEADYQHAIENYERVAKSAINNNLMKWSVKDYLLKAGICHLANGVSPLCPSQNTSLSFLSHPFI